MSHHFSTVASRVAVITTTGAAVLATTMVAPVAASATPVAPAALSPAAPVLTSPAAPPSLDAPAAPAAVVAPAALRAPAGPTVAPPVSVPTAAPTSVVQSAMSKIGSPYRWGATGPNAFDCSGLVLWSYKRAGVNLPRSSRAMSQVGTPVSVGQLRPGDLVFSYRPVSHVAIYIGNGQVVHASTSSSPVKVSPLDLKNFSGARRI